AALCDGTSRRRPVSRTSVNRERWEYVEIDYISLYGLARVRRAGCCNGARGRLPNLGTLHARQPCHLPAAWKRRQGGHGATHFAAGEEPREGCDNRNRPGEGVDERKAARRGGLISGG